MNEWMNERTNEWMNEWMNLRAYAAVWQTQCKSSWAVGIVYKVEGRGPGVGGYRSRPVCVFQESDLGGHPFPTIGALLRWTLQFARAAGKHKQQLVSGWTPVARHGQISATFMLKILFSPMARGVDKREQGIAIPTLCHACNNAGRSLRHLQRIDFLDQRSCEFAFCVRCR